MDGKAQALLFSRRRPAISPAHGDSSYVLIDSDGVCIVAEPNTYTRIAELADAGRLEVRFARLGGTSVALAGEAKGPHFVLKLRVLEERAYPPPQHTPLWAGTYIGGAHAQRELGLLEPSGLEPGAGAQPGLGFGTPEEEAWRSSELRFRVVGAPF